MASVRIEPARRWRSSHARIHRRQLNFIASRTDYDYSHWSLTMADTEMMASRFKAECLAVLDRVRRTRQPIVITKHGRPVARVVPVDEALEPRETAGSVRLLAADDEAYYSTRQDWEAEGSGA
jgi:prevent-host-death family protein